MGVGGNVFSHATGHFQHVGFLTGHLSGRPLFLGFYNVEIISFFFWTPPTMAHMLTVGHFSIEMGFYSKLSYLHSPRGNINCLSN